MKNTWMLKINLNHCFTPLTESICFFYYFLKFFNFFSLLVKNFNNIFLLFCFKVKNYLSMPIKKEFFIFNKNYLKFHKYLNIDTNFKLNNRSFIEINENIEITKRNFSKKNDKFLFKIFNLLFLFNYSLFNSCFKIHQNFKLLYAYNFKNKLIIINSAKFLFRWKDVYDLMFNIFFYKFNPLIFGSNLFKNEILALNWNYNFFDVKVWKYYFPFFTFKLNNYNKKIDFFFSQINQLNINFFLITDCLYHFKSLPYLKKKNLYTVGLVDINLDPWIVTYPILNFFESYLTQLFFFKFILFIEKKSISVKYLFYKKNWFFFIFNKNLKNTILLK